MVSNDAHKMTGGFVMGQMCIFITPLSLYLVCKAIALPLENMLHPLQRPMGDFSSSAIRISNYTAIILMDRQHFESSHLAP